MFVRILVPLDGSPTTECVLPHAIAIAKAFNAVITLAHVLEQPPASLRLPKADPLDWYLKKSAAKLYLTKIQAHLQENHVESDVLLLEGKVADQIVRQAHAMPADLLILSSHGSGKPNTGGVSSNVQHILQQVRVSVLIIRTSTENTGLTPDLTYQRMLVPLDGSRRGGTALAIATAFAEAFRSEILLAHVVTRPEMARHMPLTQEETALVSQIVERNQEEGGKYLEQVREQLRPSSQIRLLVGDSVARSLQNLSEEEQVDLLVLSAHGYSGETRSPYGSITNRFIIDSAIPLLIVQDLQPDSQEITRSDEANRQPTRLTYVG